MLGQRGDEFPLRVGDELLDGLGVSLRLLGGVDRETGSPDRIVGRCLRGADSGVRRVTG